VAVFVKPFVSSFWSAVVLCSRTYCSLRRCDLGSGRSHAWGIPASNDLLSVAASVHRPPDPACAYGPWRAPWWPAPAQARAATRPLAPRELPTPHPCAPQEVWHFVRDSLLRRREHGTAFGCPRGQALRSRHHVLPLLRETVAASRRQRGAVPPAAGLPLLGAVPAGGPHPAVRRQPALEAVDAPRPLPCRRRYGAGPRATVVCLHPGDPDAPPPLPCPRAGAPEPREPLLHSEPSGRGPPVAAMDCKAGRVDHAVGPPWGTHQRWRQKPSRPASSQLLTGASAGSPQRSFAWRLSSRPASIGRAGTVRARGRWAAPVVTPRVHGLALHAKASHSAGRSIVSDVSTLFRTQNPVGF
jgi:hypothetical protein